MNALKPTFFKPASRPSSPLPSPSMPLTPRPEAGAAPASTGNEGRAARPLSKKLALSHFSRKPSPAPSRSVTPTPLVQDGSYLESLGLKLSEAASKALAQPVSPVATADMLNGKRPIPADRGRAFGELIASEFRASKGKVHLQRAILRLLQRPMSVLITNLSSLLLPLLSSPMFLTPAAPTVASPNPNPTQAHALSVARFAGELADCLDELEVDDNLDLRGDALKGFKDGLNSVVGRVMNPLLSGLKSDLQKHLRALESVNPSSPVTGPVKTANGHHRLGVTHHPSVILLQALMPVYAKSVKVYTAPKVMQTALATFLISSVWSALVALSHRPSLPRSRSNSVSATSATSSATFKKRLGGAAAITPPPTPPSSRFTMKLPGSRPPSPTHAPAPSTVADARVIGELLGQLPRPIASDDASRIASEAVDEAFEALGALTALLGAIDSPAFDLREDLDLDLLTEDLPVLIALPVLLRWSGHGEPQVIAAMLGIEEAEYRGGFLSGFGRAEECEDMVAARMVEILRNDATEDTKTKMVFKYLEECIIGGD